jgi:hypothetical protein
MGADRAGGGDNETMAVDQLRQQGRVQQLRSIRGTLRLWSLWLTIMTTVVLGVVLLFVLNKTA